jgi:asparagine synthase (glutamine-hydrolysing)
MKTVSENNIKVLLDGQGADETLGGYYPFAGIYLVEELIDFRIFRFFRDYYDTRQNFTNNINIHMGRSLYYFLPSRIQKYIRQKKRLGPGLLSKDFRYLLESMDVPDIGGRSFNEHSIKSIRWGLTELLRYEDRNSMAFSIESRVPFLDHRLVDYALSLEKEYKLHYGWTKYILRKAAKPYLPEEIIYRKDKIGFATPQKEWKSEKTQNLRDYIQETNIPEILDAVRLMEICNSDLKNPTQNSEFWRIVTLLKWFEIFKVRLS